MAEVDALIFYPSCLDDSKAIWGLLQRNSSGIRYYIFGVVKKSPEVSGPFMAAGSI